MKKLFINLCLIVVVAMISGCFRYTPRHLTYSRDINDQKNFTILSYALERYGAKVMRSGDHHVIAIPNSALFTKNSANMTGQAHSVLELVYGMIGYYEDPSVAVNGYYSSCGDSDFGKALAKDRARRVVRYLWRSGVDSNFVYSDAKMLGSSKRDLELTDNIMIFISKPN